MRKGTDKKTMSRVIKDSHSFGIKVSVNVLVGFPGEEEEDFQQTIDFIEAHKDYIDQVNTGATLGIGVGSELHTSPHQFDIRTNQDGSIFYEPGGSWASTDGRNTHKVRSQRLDRLKEFLCAENIRH